MVTIKEAVQRSLAFARDTLGPELTEGVRLEEVESTTVSGQNAWLITLSMIAPPDDARIAAIGGIAGLLGAQRRAYKTFTVLKEDGEVTAMKIRELADA